MSEDRDVGRDGCGRRAQLRVLPKGKADAQGYGDRQEPHGGWKGATLEADVIGHLAFVDGRSGVAIVVEHQGGITNEGINGGEFHGELWRCVAEVAEAAVAAVAAVAAEAALEAGTIFNGLNL